MTIITKCPHCNTTFNVPDAVLLKFKGLVRCANCNGVFNAIENRLRKVTANNQSKPQSAQAPAASVDSKVNNIAKVPLQTESKKTVEIVEKADSSLQNNPKEKETASIVSQSVPKPTINIQEEITQPSLGIAVKPSLTDNFKEILQKHIFDKLDKYKQDKKLNEPKNLVGNTNLNKRLNSWGNNQKKRPYFIAGSTFLGLALFIQILYWQRNNIANYMPFTTPVLKSLSKVLGGKLAPLKLQDNPVVSFSDMQKDMAFNANRYVLSIGLQNKYDSEVAMPNLEISLFDLNEQMITRRVFHPQEFLKPMEWKRLSEYGLKPNEELPVKLRFETNQAISSFKVVVFYP